MQQIVSEQFYKIELSYLRLECLFFVNHSLAEVDKKFVVVEISLEIATFIAESWKRLNEFEAVCVDLTCSFWRRKRTVAENQISLFNLMSSLREILLFT